MKKQISGWGKNTFVNSNIFFPKNLSQLKKNIKRNCIARGLGRSYGDSSIQSKKTIVTTYLNKILSFDKNKGIIDVESGISIKKILHVIVKDGWFLPVTPGSKMITVGGMVASDVHGKNHHKDGNFSNFVLGLKLFNNKKQLIECSSKKNTQIFNYTFGGMGLTGIIYSCKIKLKKINSHNIITETIKNHNLKETLKSINKSKNWDYNVAWIDTSSKMSKLGRSILTRGYFSKKRESDIFFKDKKFFISNLPNIFPSWFMNSFFVKLLNDIYFIFHRSSKSMTNINNFFYPLDKINNWNVVYGKQGFISYQCSVPHKNSLNSISEILRIIKENKIYSFVSVLKSMKKNKYDLSFGQQGYTLVFDFPIYDKIFEVLDSIDEVVEKNKGKIYLTKDSRIKKEKFYKINKEFRYKKFKTFRKKIDYYFNSMQSKRLEI